VQAELADPRHRDLAGAEGLAALREQFGDVDLEPFGELAETVVGERHQPTFDLRHGGDGQPRAAGDVGQRQLAVAADAAQPLAHAHAAVGVVRHRSGCLLVHCPSLSRRAGGVHDRARSPASKIFGSENSASFPEKSC